MTDSVTIHKDDFSHKASFLSMTWERNCPSTISQKLSETSKCAPLNWLTILSHTRIFCYTFRVGSEFWVYFCFTNICWSTDVSILINFKLGFRQLRTYFKSNICFLSNNTMRRNVTLQFLFCHDDTNDYVQHGLNWIKLFSILCL